MKFLFMSKSGDSLPLATRVEDEGNEVAVHIWGPHSDCLGAGIVHLVDKWQLKAERADVIVFDMVGRGRVADQLRSSGKLVVGASTESDRLELDRSYGTTVMKAHGIAIPRTQTFKSFMDGIAYARQRKERLVFKPSLNQPCVMTYVADSSDDMVEQLKFFRSRAVGPAVEFELQDVVDGIEVSTEGWFSGGQFVRPFNATMEEKRLFDGGHGPQTGCMGNTVWHWNVECPPAAAKTLLKLESFLKRNSYCGPLDINTIVHADGTMCGLEFTARMGYSAIYSFVNLLDCEVGKFLHDCAAGTLRSFDVHDGFSTAVRLSVPPWPHSEDATEAEGVPIQGVTPANEGQVFLLDVYLDGDALRIAGSDGVVAEAVGRGSTVGQSARSAYSVVRQLSIPNVQYRSDIGDRAAAQVPLLKAMGFMEDTKHGTVQQEDRAAGGA